MSVFLAAMRARFADGLLSGLVRLALGTLCILALVRACRGSPAMAGVLLAAVFALVLGAVAGWRALLLLFAPERALWVPEPACGWPGRLGLTAWALVAGWFFWTCVTMGFCPYGGLIVGVPLVASLVQRWCCRARHLNVAQTGCGRQRGTVSVPQATSRSAAAVAGYRCVRTRGESDARTRDMQIIRRPTGCGIRRDRR